MPLLIKPFKKLKLQIKKIIKKSNQVKLFVQETA